MKLNAPLPRDVLNYLFHLYLLNYFDFFLVFPPSLLPQHIIKPTTFISFPVLLTFTISFFFYYVFSNILLSSPFQKNSPLSANVLIVLH